MLIGPCRTTKLEILIYADMKYFLLICKCFFWFFFNDFAGIMQILYYSLLFTAVQYEIYLFISPGKITKVFISHLHGDHLFGLPGLLCTISLNSNPQPDQPPPCVDIYGPRGLRHFVRVALELSGSQLLFPYAVHELEPSDDQCPAEGRLSPVQTSSSDTLHPQERPGRTICLDPDTDCYDLIDDKQFVVKAFKLYHRVPSFGFSVEERERPGRLNTDLLKELGNSLSVKNPSFFFLLDWTLFMHCDDPQLSTSQI